MRRRLLLAPATCLAFLALACSGDSEPAPTLSPTPTQTPTPAPATATPLPTATPRPTVSENVAIVVGGDLRVRSAATTQSEVLNTLPDRSVVVIDAAVQGENWLVGSQTWVPAAPDWTTTWFRLTDGSYVYAAFVFILQPGEATPLVDPAGQEKWIDVNVTTQTATAMLGQTPLYTAPVSTGSPQFPSPIGTHRLQRDGRVPVERMTASQAGYVPGQATYDVERVLFTQYYDNKGDALHLNYWRPKEVFGRTATSHGCVGMQLHDAQWFWLYGEPDMRVEIHP
ncbi:MAG: L,D-transpeptidase [Chloroflexi bacterium]|nr:L,D-transpeptidase [Chloroflexota bacterium]